MRVIIIFVRFGFESRLELSWFGVFLAVFFGDDVFLERAVLSGFRLGVCSVVHGCGAVNFNNLI